MLHKMINWRNDNLQAPQKGVCLKPPFHKGLFCSREYPTPFYCLIGCFLQKYSATCAHCPIHSGEDLEQSPQSSESWVAKKWLATVFETIADRNKSVQGCLAPPRVPEGPFASPGDCSFCIASAALFHTLELSYTLCCSLLHSGAFV